MTMFTFDVASARSTYESQGWVHIRNGAHPDLVESLRRTATEIRAAAALTGAGLAGAKKQFLFEPPAGSGFPDEFFDVVAGVTGLERRTMTLSERHIKAYDDDADPDPLPHKDRYASQVAVGVTVVAPPGTTLVLYPHDQRAVNPFLTTEFRERLEPEELPENALRDARPVEIADAPGDVVMFPGSSVWHLRRRSAGATLLYLKCNDFGSDPLGEDPTTAAVRETSVTNAAAPDLGGLVPVLSRRYDSVTRTYRRNGDVDTVAVVWGTRPVRLSPEEAELIRAVDGRRAVADIAPNPAAEALVRRLVTAGVLDLRA